MAPKKKMIAEEYGNIIKVHFQNSGLKPHHMRAFNTFLNQLYPRNIKNRPDLTNLDWIGQNEKKIVDTHIS